MDNYNVAAYMIEHCGEGRGSIITGSSVHNSRVERSHRDIYSGVLAFYARIFQELEDEGNLDVLNDVHLFSLHHVYIARINRSLQEFVQQMNNRPVSTEHNQSPLQMWERGMLENIHSGHTALTPVETEHFGVDPNGVLRVEEEDYQVSILPPIIQLQDEQLEQLEQLPDLLTVDGNNGKTIFVQTVNTITSTLSSQ
jgi:hypothetical protein